MAWAQNVHSVFVWMRRSMVSILLRFLFVSSNILLSFVLLFFIFYFILFSCIYVIYMPTYSSFSYTIGEMAMQYFVFIVYFQCCHYNIIILCFDDELRVSNIGNWTGTRQMPLFLVTYTGFRKSQHTRNLWGSYLSRLLSANTSRNSSQKFPSFQYWVNELTRNFFLWHTALGDVRENKWSVHMHIHTSNINIYIFCLRKRAICVSRICVCAVADDGGDERSESRDRIFCISETDICADSAFSWLTKAYAYIVIDYYYTIHTHLMYF